MPRVLLKQGAWLATVWSVLTCFTFAWAMPAYDRSEWPHWIDSDRDCQNTRAEILIASSLISVNYKPGRGCYVLSGRWYGVYTDRFYHRASEIDIDHIVPLFEAHLSGGARWSRAQRRAFANDPLNLVPVERAANRGKGADDPAAWRPPNKNIHCAYSRRWIDVKTKYRLVSDRREAQALRSMLSLCGHANQMILPEYSIVAEPGSCDLRCWLRRVKDWFISR